MWWNLSFIIVKQSVLTVSHLLDDVVGDRFDVRCSASRTKCSEHRCASVEECRAEIRTSRDVLSSRAVVLDRIGSLLSPGMSTESLGEHHASLNSETDSNEVHTDPVECHQRTGGDDERRRRSDHRSIAGEVSRLHLQWTRPVSSHFVLLISDNQLPPRIAAWNVSFWMHADAFWLMRFGRSWSASKAHFGSWKKYTCGSVWPNWYAIDGSSQFPSLFHSSNCLSLRFLRQFHIRSVQMIQIFWLVGIPQSVVLPIFNDAILF